MDHSTGVFHFWSHPRYFEALCLGPTHLPKSWKNQIKKLRLSSLDSKALLGRVWAFALKMELTDLAKLDEEWELVTQFALSLAKVQPEASDVLLPAELRLACQALTPEAASTSACFSGQAVTDSQYRLYVDISNRLDSISAQIQRGRSDSSLESQSIEKLRNELSNIASLICLQGVKDNELCKMMELHCAIQKHKCKNKDAATGSFGGNSGSGSAVTAKQVLSAMQNIYELARCWCQRVTCQGFNMQRRSSTWSEVSNNSIKAYIRHSKLMSGEYTLSSFIMDVDRWVHKQCERAYHDNQMTFKFKSEILSEHHVVLLQQILCNGALTTLLKEIIPRTMRAEFVVESESVDLSSCCTTARERVQQFMRVYDIELSEVKVFKATSSEPMLPSVAEMQCWETRSAAEGDLVHASLVEASDLANKTSVQHFIAVYQPSGGVCKIPFFNEGRPIGNGVPFFCTCMKHSARGLPCEHQISWILQHRPRSIWALVFLCHPVFVRGHQVS
jgi:hypothetical protein